MASQQTRSAFWLTTIAIISFSNQCYLYATASVLLDESISEITSAFKFGDRISPRNRSFIDLDKPKISLINEFNNQNSNSNNNQNINGGNSATYYGLINSNVRKNLASIHNSDFNADLYGNDDDDDDERDISLNDHDGAGQLSGSDTFVQRSASSSPNELKQSYLNRLNETSSSSVSGRSSRKEGRSFDDDDETEGLLTNIESPVIGDSNGGSGNQIDIRDGNASSAQAHRLEMSTEFFVVPSTFPTVSRSSNHRPGGIILPNKASASNFKNTASIVPPYSSNRVSNATQPTIISTHSPLGLRKEPWVVPVLVLTSLAMLMMAAFEIFVLCKAWQTSPSRRHLFLGQMLLLGLFMCAGLAAILTTTPTVLSCGIVRFGAGVAFALVFASLLVKCVFLISLNSGVYLPAPYQGLLLLFAVLIQVAVGAQWLITSPAAVEDVSVPVRNGPLGLTRYTLLLTAQDISMSIPLCKTQFPELLYSLVYVVFLILFVAVLAIKSRRIRENYREATYIGLAIGGAIPIWLGWTLCGLAVTERHKDACLAFGLVATSATVFLVMFMPKGRQLAAMGKEGLYIEDRDEQFSSLSRAGSGYSPSFFHFKPIKYGVMGNTITSTTNTANGTTSKHQAVASLGNGKWQKV